MKRGIYTVFLDIGIRVLTRYMAELDMTDRQKKRFRKLLAQHGRDISFEEFDALRDEAMEDGGRKR